MAEIFAAGGFVMWPLLLFSMTTLTLSTERLIFWLRVNRRQKRIMIRSFYRRQVALLQEYGGQLEILYEWHHKAQQQNQEDKAYARVG
ncbi:MAG: hypothetical protein J7647_23410 [Cyanobacteria bacterium SBLK]|nr:hypothetical protein [Cyanobacteria bacterium SBLK]